jgi:hypothetical protein
MKDVNPLLGTDRRAADAKGKYHRKFVISTMFSLQ